MNDRNKSESHCSFKFVFNKKKKTKTQQKVWQQRLPQKPHKMWKCEEDAKTELVLSGMYSSSHDKMHKVHFMKGCVLVNAYTLLFKYKFWKYSLDFVFIISNMILIF